MTLGWSLGVESDPYQLWHSSQAEEGSNFVGFKNPRADILIEQAREEFSRPGADKEIRGVLKDSARRTAVHIPVREKIHRGHT